MIRFSSACVTVTVVAVKLRIEVCAMVVAISCDVPVTFFLFSGSMETVYCVPGLLEILGQRIGVCKLHRLNFFLLRQIDRLVLTRDRGTISVSSDWLRFMYSTSASFSSCGLW